MPKVDTSKFKNSDAPSTKEAAKARAIELALPEYLAAARKRSGLSQKALAGAVSLDPSYLCGIERGRRKVPLKGTVAALGAALALNPEEFAELNWAATHDVVQQKLTQVGLGGAGTLVSLALRAAHYLTLDEQQGLERRLREVIRSKRYVLDLKLDGHPLAAVQENTMT